MCVLVSANGFVVAVDECAVAMSAVGDSDLSTGADGGKECAGSGVSADSVDA